MTLDSSIYSKTVGNWGDAAIFSTEHSKPLNTIIGGFFYTNNKELSEKITLKVKKIQDLDEIHQKNLVKQFKFERKYYNPKMYGKRFVFRICQKDKYNKYFAKNKTTIFLNYDYGNPSRYEKRKHPYPAKMPACLAQLGIYELERWNIEKERRKKILKNYLSISEDIPVKSFLPKCYYDEKYDIVPLRIVFAYPKV